MRHGSGGEFLIEQSSGGLATALSHTHTEMDSLWIGWPGGHFKAGEPRKRMQQLLRHEHRCVPVFLSGQAMQRYDYGFSNRALWPLFHSFQSYLVYHEEEWEAHVNANRVFCDAVLQEARRNDLIWGQDYHLFLLPDMLRQHLPDDGTTTWTPLQYVHRHLPFHEICALLRRADVALVTPLRAGMNLVAKEYAACQENRPGALILSEFAGASSEMGEAFFVNSYDEAGMAARLAEVLTLPEDHLQNNGLLQSGPVSPQRVSP
jgi:trehalose-6-phosphate synthase